MELYYCYILQSTVNKSFYIGQTSNLLKRLVQHNKGESKYTKEYLPWNLVWCVFFKTRSEAFRLEQKLKGLKSRERIIKFMEENPCMSGSESYQISNLI